MKKNNYAILIGTMGIVFTFGSLYSFPIMSSVIAKTNNISDLEAIYPFMISLLIAFIPMFLGGIVSDIGKSKLIILGGGFIYALSFLSLALNSQWINVIVYGFIGSFALNFAYAGATSNIIRTFDKNEGTYLSMVTGMMIMGTIFSNILFDKLINSKTFSHTIIIMSLIYFLILLMSTKLLNTNYKIPSHDTENLTINIKPMFSYWKKLIVDPSLYLIIMILILGSLPGFIVSSDITNFSTKIMSYGFESSLWAANIFTIARFMGLLLFNFLGDKTTYQIALKITFSLMIISLLLMFGMHNLTVYYLAIFMLGISFGGTTGIAPVLTSIKYGKKYQGISYGTVFIGYSLTGFISPKIAQYLSLQTNNFGVYFRFLILVSIIGLILNLFKKNNRNKVSPSKISLNSN